jgi:regulator of cell morphogenesis and NO signaling
MNTSRTLGQLATELPGATRVFLRYRLDFCCGGHRSLARACQQAGLDPAAIERELEAERRRDEPGPRWDLRTPTELTDHIEAHYHAALRRDVPALIEAARKVERVHAARPDVPAGLTELLESFWQEMVDHMEKEEQILFPLIRRGIRGPGVAPPIRRMMLEHDIHGEALARIRAVTGNLHAPEGACATWRALYDGLTRLETELMQHIHLENNVLFTQALARDDGAPARR